LILTTDIAHPFKFTMYLEKTNHFFNEYLKKSHNTLIISDLNLYYMPIEQ
jgi:hypothetical protein